ncbi:uncharacterized protein Dwil_GK25530 [Drosophila willistoni]|uniref:DUF4794 domain-containing protein n=1 Tax=Drosophila willistoni TaxID=7260 RepID=B4NDX1_DROWI|nr:SAGA-associated factor 73 [Drosophila willistoni]EDW81940.1 uncharacterized protein Dwil_GK25530 [Drosophila willistoni]
MSKLSCLFVLLSCCSLLAWAEPRLQQQQLQQQLKLKQFNQMSSTQHPYLFLTIPRGRANAGAVVQGFEIVEEPEDDDDNELDDQLDLAHNDDDLDDDNDDDEDALADDDEHEESQMNRQHNKFARHGQLVFLNAANPDNDVDDDSDDVDEPVVPVLRKAPSANSAKLTQAKPTQMMVARDQAGAIMVPDGIIEIEGQSVVDEKTGKAALLVPRAALDAIPDGAVVALMERSAVIDPTNGDREEERANRVTVRRRKTGGRRNVRLRRRGGNNSNRRRRVNGGNRRRGGGNRRRNVRVVRPGRGGSGGGQRRRRRNGQVVLQG